MPIEFRCPQCRRKYMIPDKRAGQEGKCNCGHAFVVPGMHDRQEQKPTFVWVLLALGVVVGAAALFGLSYWLMH